MCVVLGREHVNHFPGGQYCLVFHETFVKLLDTLARYHLSRGVLENSLRSSNTNA